MTVRLFNSFWRWLIDFFTAEPTTAHATPDDARAALLCQLDGLRRVAAMRRSLVDDLACRLQAAELRSSELASRARALIVAGQDDEARRVLAQKLEVDDELQSLRERHAEVQSQAQGDAALCAEREAEVRERLEESRELDSLQAQRSVLARRKRARTGVKDNVALAVEEARIAAEIQRLTARAELPMPPAAAAARRVTHAYDEAVIEAAIAKLKQEAERS